MTAQQLKNSILQLAVQGKLVPQDPNDEPASVLLERITKERERLIKEKKIKKPKTTSRIYRRDGHYYESINGGESACIDEQIPFDIPDSWEWVRLSEIVSIQTGKKDANFGSEDGVYPFFTCAKEPIKCKTYSYDCEAILLAGNGDIGNISFFKGKFEAYQRTYILENAFNINLKYLYYHILYNWLEYNLGQTFGSAIPYIRLGNLQSYLVAIPPTQEQGKIIDEIDKVIPLVRTYDDLSRKVSSLNDAFPDQLKKSILQYAIQGKLVPQEPTDEPASVLLVRIAKERAKLGKKAAKSMSRIERRDRGTYEIFPDGSEKDISGEIPFDIPDSWEWCRLREACYAFQYGTAKKSEKTGKAIVLRMGNIQDGEVDFRNLVFSNDASDLLALELRNGDVLFNRTNSEELVGKSAIFRGHKIPTIFAGYLIRIIKGMELNGEYLNYFLNSPFAWIQGRTVLSLGVNQANISGAKLANYLFPLPPLKEQHRIVERLGVLMKKLGTTK